jgi:hypothetical protein
MLSKGNISMCIYCGTDKYRKIYENHYGPIPKDAVGRSYDIHHLDGNHKNNDPKNLKAVTVQEHYNIHYSQGDYGACVKLKKRLALTPEELSILASLHNKKRWAALGRNHPAALNNYKRVKDGTHNFLGKDTNQKRIDSGTHNWVQEWNCVHCGKTGKNLRLYERWGHSDGKCILPRDFIPANADKNVYKWINKITGETVELTRTDLARKFNLNTKDIWRVVNKRIKTTKGWGLAE